MFTMIVAAASPPATHCAIHFFLVEIVSEGRRLPPFQCLKGPVEGFRESSSEISNIYLPTECASVRKMQTPKIYWHLWPMDPDVS